MAHNPETFMDDWDEAMSASKDVSLGNYQKKILKKYFPDTGGILNSIWSDHAVKNKLEEVKFKCNDPILNAIDIKKYPTMHIMRMYKNLPKQPVWPDLMSLIQEKEQAGIIFPILHMGNYILHNFSRQPDDVLKEPKIIWPGNSGLDLTLQKLDVFLIEYNSGE